MDITLQAMGDDIVRINIDDDSDNKSTWFKIPFTPKNYTVNSRKILDYVTFSETGKDFFLTVHSAVNASNVYFKIESNNLLFGP